MANVSRTVNEKGIEIDSYYMQFHDLKKLTYGVLYICHFMDLFFHGPIIHMLLSSFLVALSR